MSVLDTYCQNELWVCVLLLGWGWVGAICKKHTDTVWDCPIVWRVHKINRCCSVVSRGLPLCDMSRSRLCRKQNAFWHVTILQVVGYVTQQPVLFTHEITHKRELWGFSRHLPCRLPCRILITAGNCPDCLQSYYFWSGHGCVTMESDRVEVAWIWTISLTWSWYARPPNTLQRPTLWFGRFLGWCSGILGASRWRSRLKLYLAAAAWTVTGAFRRGDRRLRQKRRGREGTKTRAYGAVVVLDGPRVGGQG